MKYVVASLFLQITHNMSNELNERDKYIEFISDKKHVKNLAIEYLNKPYNKNNPISSIPFYSGWICSGTFLSNLANDCIFMKMK